jgi:RND family efflux transporter MFP subunit
MSLRTVWKLFGFAGLLAGFGCHAGSAERRGAFGPTPAPVSLEVAPVHAEAFTRRYRASATLRGRNTAVVTSRTSGYVSRVGVKAGERVAAGQLLVELESRELEAAVRRARAGIGEAEHARLEADNAVLAADADLSIARLTHERSQKLLATDAIAPAEFDRSFAQQRARAAQASMAGARRQAAASRIEQARAELMQAEANLDYTRIRAPFDGRVIERRIDPGNLASPGTPLLVVEQSGRFHAEAIVEEALAGRLRVGTRAALRVESLGREGQGRITEVVPAVDAGSRTFVVKVELPATMRSAGLQPGLYARVEFPLGARSHTAVPESAVAPWGQIDRVFVVESGRAHARIVTLGERQGALVEVLSGLDPGEKIVLKPPRGLLDGARVEASAAVVAALRGTRR